MAFRCMNCNGSMVFDVKLQQMRCQHCGSVCDPEDFVMRDTSPEANGNTYVNDGNMKLFTCQNCAATLEATEDSMIGICPYCGGQSFVTSDAQSQKIEHIIPFKISKEECVELYSNYAQGIRYLPKELRDPEFIRNFTGIYMPFFQYDAQFGAVHVTGEKTVESNRRYDVVNSYRIEGEIVGDYPRGVTFDGSRYLADEISERVLPYDTSYECAFYPGFLAGFYADASTVDPERYYPDAAVRAEEDMLGAIVTSIKGNTGIKVDESSTVKTTITGHHQVLHPLWFLTWRKNDRVAYAVINGESGKVVSDLPLDLGSFALGCAVVAAVLFALLELFVQPTPLITSAISLGAAFLMAWGIKTGAQREFEQHTHATDRGWDGDGSSSPVRARRRISSWSFTPKLENVFTYGLFAIAICFGITTGLGEEGTLLTVAKYALSLMVLAYSGYVASRIFMWRKHLSMRDPAVAIAVLLLTVVINALIIIISPVNDGWYYVGDAICILGLVLSAIGMLRTYNVSTTRPLPKLFDRTEV